MRLLLGISQEEFFFRYLTLVCISKDFENLVRFGVF